jgi:hypothetical protein
MKMLEDKEKIIAFLVEKSVKGIKKQLKGYTNDIKSEIFRESLSVKHRKEDFERLLSGAKKIRCDFSALELMIDEGKRNHKLMIEMKELYNEMRNELMNMKLTLIEIRNNEKIKKE